MPSSLLDAYKSAVLHLVAAPVIKAKIVAAGIDDEGDLPSLGKKVPVDE
jgi:hypothetical protein